METARRECPLCDEAMVESEGVFTCAEHGDWHRYSPALLVRAPSAEAKPSDKVLMPWEQLNFGTA